MPPSSPNAETPISTTEERLGARDLALQPAAVAEPAPLDPIIRPPGGFRVVYVEVVDLSPLGDETVQPP